MSRDNRKYLRSPFNEGKWVRLLEDVEGSKPKSYPIMDISRGGIGILSIREKEFYVGGKFFIVDIDGKPVGKKIRIEIKYVLPLDKNARRFRIGCEFIEIGTGLV